MGVYEELIARGLIAQVTDEEEIRELVNTGKAVFYIGFDPTADSLHVGHFMALCLMKRLQMAGNKPIALLGGGTGMIGDPSGRTDMRQMLTKEQIQHNVECFKKQMSRFIDFSDGKALMVDNAEWLLDLNYVELLREVGACFSVNRMLAAECYKQRMERGLSFLEFNYMIMQSYDFYALYQRYGCNMQFGGDDQTQSGAVWLDAEKTSPYDFYQYWRNIDDADVVKCLKMLTFLPLDEIEELSKLEGSEINKAKEILAHELTEMIHGKEEADKAQEAARALFGSKQNTDNMPSTELEDADFGDDGIGVLDLLSKCGLIPSKKEGRRLIEQGGVSLDDEKVTEATARVTKEAFEKGFVVIKKGKKVFHKAILK